MIPKAKRKVDKKAINFVKNQPCVISGRTPCDAHHITSVGAGGDDTLENLMPLRHEYHVELHQIGINKFTSKYPSVIQWLIINKRLDILGKLQNDNRF